MSGFETPARRSALVSLVAGLTLTDSGIIGSPLSLSGLVEAKDLDEQPPRGRAMVYLAPVVSNTRPRGLWMGLSQTWRLLLYVPVTMAATSAVLDEVQEELMSLKHYEERKVMQQVIFYSTALDKDSRHRHRMLP